MSTLDYSTRAMVTGHRLVNSPVIQPALIRINQRCIDKFGFENIINIAGGAGGADFDHAWATKRSGLPLHLEIPHIGYYDKYHPISEENWAAMLAYAETVHYTVEGGAFNFRYNFRRNEEMVRLATHHIAISYTNPVILGEQYRKREVRGGTAACCSIMPRFGVRTVLWVNAETGEDQWVKF